LCRGNSATGESVTSAVQVPVIIAIAGCCRSCVVGLQNKLRLPAALFYSIEAFVMTAKTNINVSEQVVVIDEKKS